MQLRTGLRIAIRQVILRFLKLSVDRPILKPADLDYESVRRIIILHPHGNLHDLLLCLPAIRAIWQGFPSAHVTVLTKAELQPVLRNNPYIDEVIGFEQLSGYKGVRRIAALAEQLRANYDLAIVWNTGSQSLVLDLMALTTQARYIVGPEYPAKTEDHRSLYNLVVPHNGGEKHELEKHLRIVRHLGLDINDLSESIYCTPEEKRKAIAFLIANGIRPEDEIVLLRLGPFVPVENAWPLDKFARIAHYFRVERQWKVMVSWMPEQERLGEAFLERVDCNPIKLVERDHRRLASVLYFCHIVVTNDLDFTHLAAAVGTPAVTLFGETDPRKWKPIGEQYIALKSESGSNASIDVDEVVRCAERVLGNHPKSLRLDFDDFDISDKVLQGYFAVVERFDD